jgi:hypothetical protein
VRNLLGQSLGEEPTKGEQTTSNGLLVTFGDIAAGNKDISHEKARVRTVLTWVGLFLFLHGVVDPTWLHDGNHVGDCIKVLSKVGGG